MGNCRALLEAFSSTLICPGTTHTLTRQWPRLRESSWNTSSRAITVGPSLVARPNTVSKDLAQHRRRTWHILFLAEAPDVAQRQPLPVRDSWHRTRTHSDAKEQVLWLIPLAGRCCDDCGHCESSVELGLTPAVQHRLDEVHGLGPPPLTLLYLPAPTLDYSGQRVWHAGASSSLGNPFARQTQYEHCHFTGHICYSERRSPPLCYWIRILLLFQVSAGHPGGGAERR